MVVSSQNMNSSLVSLLQNKGGLVIIAFQILMKNQRKQIILMRKNKNQPTKQTNKKPHKRK